MYWIYHIVSIVSLFPIVGVASPKAPDHQSNTGPQHLKIKCSDDFLQLLLVVD